MNHVGVPSIQPPPYITHQHPGFHSSPPETPHTFILGCHFWSSPHLTPWFSGDGAGHHLPGQVDLLPRARPCLSRLPQPLTQLPLIPPSPQLSHLSWEVKSSFQSSLPLSLSMQWKDKSLNPWTYFPILFSMKLSKLQTDCGVEPVDGAGEQVGRKVQQKCS